MSSGLSPKLPLSKSPIDGYTLNKTYEEMVVQNLKMIILTAPGERMMDPLFGVGVRNYLFENESMFLKDKLSAKIKEQVGRYMPFIEVRNISFNSIEGQENNLFLRIEFRISPLDIDTYVEINTAVN